jgi:NAD(P) transhydrogenase subunit beta
MNPTFPQIIVGVTDLGAALLFMFGLKRMSSPVTAPSGIFVAGIGMLAAVLVSFLYVFSVGADARPHLIANVSLAAAALGVGGGVAWWSGKKIAMTAMPQMVALYNGMGGGAAGAIAAVELLGGKAQGSVQILVTLLGALIGSISLSGSLIAWAKLDGVLKAPLRFRGQQPLNAIAMLATVCVGAYLTFITLTGSHPIASQSTLIGVFFGFALLFGILMTLPIGGADMPVVISIYNALTGLAVGLEGYVLQNPSLMIA